MHVAVIGLNHQTAPIELRERFRIAETDLPAALANLDQLDGIAECLILSTCNRTEVYLCAPTRAADAVVTQWFGEYFQLSADTYQHHLYARAGHKVAEHLFRVAAGIDSLVTGDAQILGQVKDAYATASGGGFTGSILNPLFQQAIAVGKRARTETEICCGAFSVGSVAAQLAKSIFGELDNRSVLVVGASEIGELTVTHLAASGATAIMVTNRTFSRAQELAARFNGHAIPFEQLTTALETTDIVISATGAQEPVITQKMVAAAMRTRRGRPIFLVDIAVPRDIAADVGNLDNVFVYNIDDLQTVVAAGCANRQGEIVKVEAIVAEEVAAFTRWLQTLDAVPLITALREQFDTIREAEIAKLRGKLRHLSPDELDVINSTMRSIVNKISHRPLVRIKDYANSDDASAKLATVCEIFGLAAVEDDATAQPRDTR